MPALFKCKCNISGHNMKIKNIKARYIFESDVIEKPNKQIIWKMGNLHSQYIEVQQSS